MKFSAENFFSKCEQIRSFRQSCSYFLKKSLTGNFIFVLIFGFVEWLLWEIGKIYKNEFLTRFYCSNSFESFRR